MFSSPLSIADLHFDQDTTLIIIHENSNSYIHAIFMTQACPLWWLHFPRNYASFVPLPLVTFWVWVVQHDKYFPALCKRSSLKFVEHRLPSIQENQNARGWGWHLAPVEVPKGRERWFGESTYYYLGAYSSCSSFNTDLSLHRLSPYSLPRHVPIFLHLLIAHANFVLIPLFYADFTVTQP
jgi:hypothetical protein